MAGEKKNSSKLARREFLAGTAAAAAFTVVRPAAVRGTTANSTIELGLLGCGGRGTWIVKLFQAHGKYKFVTCGDYYPDHADRVGDMCRIPADKRFSTLAAYKKMYATKFDAVVIETPPYFHPEQAAAAVEAGKHVYLAKPIAVDVPGCLSIEASGKKASEKKLVYLIDFQTRADEHYREAAKRIHRGDIGKLVCGDAKYPCGVMAKKGPATSDDRLREWYCDRAISGDFIVEQSIHALDVATWMMNAPPVAVMGRGGSKNLRDYGDIWDYFTLVYEFPEKVSMSFHCVQMVHGAPNEIQCRIYGQNGTFDSDYFRFVGIQSPDKAMPRQEFKNLYTSGTVVNINEFHDAVTGGDCSNPTVAPSVCSNLTAVMGRDAAYRRQPLTWDELLKSTDRLQANLAGLKS
jgi:myo-inositol 2-dehydrogenase / D-chiro-inositol 1-dehydrogenase